MTREEMVDYLCQSDYNYILETEGGLELLGSYLEFGFKGYANFTDEELRVEVLQRQEMEAA